MRSLSRTRRARARSCSMLRAPFSGQGAEGARGTSRTGTKLNEFARTDATDAFTAGIVAQVPRLVEPKTAREAFLSTDARGAGRPRQAVNDVGKMVPDVGKMVPDV